MKRTILGITFLTCLSPVTFAQNLNIQVNIKQLKSDKGQVLARLFNRADAFPKKSELSVAQIKVNIKNQQASFQFTKLSPGEYAVAVIHDENANDKLDTNWIGIPAEGVGASNNAMGNFGPPKFIDAKFRIDSDASINIDMTY